MPSVARYQTGLATLVDPIFNYGYIVEPVTKRDQRDLFPGALEMMILHCLRRRPLHGYALIQEIKRASDLEVEEGSVYPALQRMRRAGWLKAEWGVSETRRQIRLYRLTEEGRRHLETEISSFERMYRAIARVLAPARS